MNKNKRNSGRDLSVLEGDRGIENGRESGRESGRERKT